MNETVQKLLVDKTVDWFLSKESSSAGWIKKIVVGVVALVVVGYVSWFNWKRAKKMAKAQHEKDVAVEKLHQVKTDWELTKNEDEVKKKLEEISSLEKEIHKLDEEYKKIEKDLQYEEFKIEAIKNFGDMSSYFNKLNERLASVGR